MRVLFIFLDGIGLGPDDPAVNPFARPGLPTLERLLDGRKLLASSAPFEGKSATLISIDATLSVAGLPQSATGQAALLTGMNIPARIGEHYGPKPSPAVAAFLKDGTLFSRLQAAGLSSALLNAYPPRYFDSVSSGRRLYSAIPLAVTSAGLRLFDQHDLFANKALSADFTGEGWVRLLGFHDAPVRTPEAAGQLMAHLADDYDFSLFEYWSTDYAGHKQDMAWALDQLRTFDKVLRGLLSVPSPERLTLITSDHGNMEDLSTRRHTNAPVPALLVGDQGARRRFAAGLHDLTGIAPAIEQLLLR